MDYPQLKRTVYPDSPSQTHTDQAHFRDFRDYHLPLIRLHHTHLTQGIARGLEVRGTLGGTTLTVEPGVAVDPQGQLLVLTRAETRETLTLLNRTLYVTLQFAEGRGLDGRLEQVPAEQVRLRDAPTLDSGSDEAVVVLALVKTDGTGRVTALQVQDGARRFRRQLLGEQVEALELWRAVREGERVVDVPAGKLAAGEQGGLRLTVPGADDEILVAREDGGAFRRVEIRADVQVSGTIAGTLAAGTVGPGQIAAGAVGPGQVAAGAVTSVHLAEADGTSGQETGTGQGVKTGHLQDQAVTAAKLQGHATDNAQRAVGPTHLQANAVGPTHLQDQAVTAAKLQGHATDNAQRAVGPTHLQDQAVTAAKLQQHPSDSTQRAVGATHLQANAVGPTHLQTNAVTAAKLQQHPSDSTQRAVGPTHLQANAVGPTHLQANAVGPTHLQDQAVTAAKLQQHPSDSTQRAVGATHLQANAVGPTHLQDQAVTAAKLQQHPSDSTQRAVGASHIKDGAVQPAHLQANAVTAAKLQQHATDNTQRAVGPAHLQDGAVTSEKLGTLSKLDVAGRITGGGVLAGIWAAQPLSDVVISTANTWQDVPETSVTFTLDRNAVVFFTYSINVQPDRSPGGDWLGTQLVIDGVSAPESGSHFQPWATGDANMNLHGSVVRNLTARTSPYTVSLRWFKAGATVASWINGAATWMVGIPPGGIGGRTLIVMAFYQ